MTDLAEAVEDIARGLRGICSARAAVVWAHCRNAIEMVSSCGGGETEYNRGQQVWLNDRLDLQDGRPVTHETTLFVPLMSPHRDLVGLLGLTDADLERPGRRACLEGDVDRLGRLLACPVPKAGDDMLMVPLGRLRQPDGSDYLMRRMFEALLERNGWNVAQLADELNVPRTTLQNRLRRFGVQRDTPATRDPRGPRARTDAELSRALRAALWPRVRAKS